MQSIFLLLPHGGRRWVFAFLVAFAGLGMCQSAAAAVSCSASVQSNPFIYDGSEISGARLMTRMSCSGLPLNEPGSSYNIINLCSMSDASTATGTGGNTVTPWRIARSVANNVLNYQLYSGYAGGGGIPSGPLTQSGLWLGTSNFGITMSGNSNNPVSASGVRLPAVNVPASQNVPAGDYVSTVSLTVDMRLVKNNYGANCTEGTSVGTVVLNIPVIIRVGGATCSITYAAPVLVGEITETAGTVTPVTSFGGFNLVCANGTPWTAILSDGNNALGTANDRRRMVNGGSYINYQITNPDGTQLNSLSGTGTGYNETKLLNVQITSQTPASFTQGIYTDTIIISLSY